MAKISKAKAYAAAEKAESKSEKKKELAVLKGNFFTRLFE